MSAKFLPEGPVTRDGAYQLKSFIPGSRVALEWCGVLGGASVGIRRRQTDGTLVACRTSEGRPHFVELEDQFLMTAGSNGSFYLVVTGATDETSFTPTIFRLAEE